MDQKRLPARSHPLSGWRLDIAHRTQREAGWPARSASVGGRVKSLTDPLGQPGTNDRHTLTRTSLLIDARRSPRVVIQHGLVAQV